MEAWIEHVAKHCNAMQRKHPDQPLMILFDIDGTIFDVRYALHHILEEYDRVHKSSYFSGLDTRLLEPEASDPTRLNLEPLLRTKRVPRYERERIHAWYNQHRWSYDTTIESHRPCEGIFELIRVIALQPNTFVGLNSSRPEILRKETLSVVNTLAQEYRLEFTNEQLFMDSGSWVGNAPFVKVSGLKHFQNQGFIVVAVVDSEKRNLRAIRKTDPEQEIMLLHTDTVLTSCQSISKIKEWCSNAFHTRSPSHTSPHTPPSHVNFVWSGLTPQSLEDFCKSSIHWGEIDFSCSTRQQGQQVWQLDDVSEAALLFRSLDKSLRITLGSDVMHTESLIRTLRRLGLPSSRLWFSGTLATTSLDTLKRLRYFFPSAIVECDVSPIAGLLSSKVGVASRLDTFRQAGITRIGIRDGSGDIDHVVAAMIDQGYDVHIDRIRSLERLIHHALKQPTSVSFNFDLQQRILRKHPPFAESHERVLLANA